jgi:hypothetical protein
MAGSTGRRVLGAAAILFAGLTCAFAQQQGGQGQKAPQAQQGGGPAKPQPQPSAPAAVMPDEYKLNIMIRTAIVALNQANQTGNYTVLRDLGTASFRLTNDSARLAEVFQALRKRQIDLSPVLFFTPKLLQQPVMDPRGLIRLVGFFETAPERVNFDIYYLWEMGQWRLFGVGVVMSPADATAALPQQENKSAAAQQPRGAPAAAAPKVATGAKPAKPDADVRAGAKPQANAAPAKTAVENKTTTNTARIRLGAQGAAQGAAPEAAAAAPDAPAQSEAEAPASAEKPKEGLFGLW